MNRRSPVLIFALACALLLLGCRDETTVTPPHAKADAHWSYSGDTGPDRWGVIDDDYERCASGAEQSPVDLSPALAVRDANDVVFDYRASDLSIVNNGHTVQVVYEPGSTISVEAATYDLLQFHLHAQSEHTLDGTRFPLELHLVHMDSDGNLAVVGVLFEEGAPNAALEPVFSHMPSSETEEPVKVDGVTVDAAALLPESHEVFEYPGSLTTPPCSERVRWFVMARPVQASAGQIAAFTTLYSANFRPLQPLNDRELRLSEEFNR
ncbi:MAG TPA: carbonic anhydrase family protein [Thermomicrobiales bacterium]|nr:carbonic anhydrase family protein [Thermomicrobiales bacterium]